MRVLTHLETRERARAVGTDVQAACSRMRRCSSEGRDAKSVESTVRSDIVGEKPMGRAEVSYGWQKGVSGTPVKR